MTKKLKWIILLIIASMIFGSYGVFSKVLFDNFGVFYHWAVKWIIILILILPYLLYKKEIVKIDKVDMKWFWVFFIATASSQAPIYFAFKYLDVWTWNLILFVTMLLTMYVFWIFFLNEKLNKIKIISLILATIWLFLVFPLDFSNIVFFAAILMIINWIASGIEEAWSKTLSKKYSSLYLVFIWWWAIFITNMTLAIILWENLVLPEFNLPWLYLFWYALWWLFWFWSVIEWLKYVEASLWGLIWLLEIIFAIIYWILFFNEVLTFNIVIWWILILIAAWLPDIMEYLIKRKN